MYCFVYFFASNSKNDKSSEGIKFSNNARNAYISLTMVRANLVQSKFNTPDIIMKESNQTVTRLVELYKNRSDKLLDSGRDLENDQVIWGDTTTCSEFYKKIKQ